MGLTKRPYPVKLADKLLEIREALRLSQSGMLRKLGFDELYDRSTISGYERGEREPPLPVLLRYAEVANICLNLLVDDRLTLPRQLPTKKRDRHS